MDNNQKINLFLQVMEDFDGECSANDVINTIYLQDIRNGVNRNSWRFYVHLNKLPAVMSKEGYIIDTGKFKKGEFKPEKIWKLNDRF